VANPLQAITEALAQAAQEADVLPASGQATIDEARPDIEEWEDARLTGDERVYDTIWEAPEDGTTPPLYAPCPPPSREEDHLYRYCNYSPCPL
jgi:hypothetical protein